MGRRAPPSLGRRQWLRGGLGALGTTMLAPGCGEPVDALRSCEAPLLPDAAYGRPSPETETIVDALLAATEDDIIPTCTTLLRAHPSEAVLGGILVAGARSILPDSGGALHAPLSIHATLHGHRALDGPERLVPIYYAAHALKFRQGITGLPGPVPTAVERSPEDAVARLDAAMELRDPEAADAAVLDLFASVPVDLGVERLIRWGTRDPGDLGHLMIWFGLALRSLDELGWQHAPSVLRSVIWDATSRPPGPLDDMHAEHLARLESAAPPPSPCGLDEGLTRELVVELRGKDPEAAAAFVLELVLGAASSDALWDAFAVSGTDDLVRNGAGVALHRFDGMNAMHHLWRRSSEPLHRQLVLVQTAATMASIDAPDVPTDVFELEPTPVEGLEEVWRAVPAGPLTAAEHLLGYLEGGGTIEPLRAEAELLMVRKAHRVDEHSYKFPVAVLEETALASDPWKPLVLAGLGGQYGRSPSTAQEDWDHLEEVMAEIATL